MTALAENSPYYYGQVVSPPITRTQTGVNACNTTKIVTPIGEWGCRAEGSNTGGLMA